MSENKLLSLSLYPSRLDHWGTWQLYQTQNIQYHQSPSISKITGGKKNIYIYASFDLRSLYCCMVLVFMAYNCTLIYYHCMHILYVNEIFMTF